jgi:hypothetical protein
MRKYSQSIEESKANDVFRHALKVDNSIINIGNNSKDTVIEIWVENGWEYTKDGLGVKIRKDSSLQILIRLASLSRKYDDRILFKCNGNYFGWNGVLFDSYQNGQNIIEIVSKNNSQETSIDTLLITH